MNKSLDGFRITVQILAVILIGFLIYDQVIAAPSLAKKAEEVRKAQETIVATRGDILDVNGSVMATNVDQYLITVDQRQISKFVPIDCKEDKSNAKICHQINGKPVGAKGAAGIARIMGDALKRDPVELGYRLFGVNNYAVAVRNVSPEDFRNLETKHITNYYLKKLTVNRFYPNGKISGEEIGVASSVIDPNDRTPKISAKTGIELMMNDVLGGKDGTLYYEHGNTGRRIPTGQIKRDEPEQGKNIKLTIDLDIQWKLQQLLDDTKKKWGAGYGYAVVEDIKTGKIYAIGATDELEAGSDKLSTSGSRAFAEEFEAGSTVKIIVGAGLMQYGIADAETPFGIRDTYITKNGQEIKDAKEHPPGDWTLSGLIGMSYNTGTVMASEPMSDQQRYDMLREFGFGEKTTVGFPNEAPGTVHGGNPKDLMDGRMRHTILFGQGFTATALQLVNSYATIANKGIDPQPTIIDSVQETNGNWVEYKGSEFDKTKPEVRQNPRKAVDENIADRTISIMEASVLDGISSGAKIEGYRVGGKSGTAEMQGKDGLSDILQSFISVVPADNPRFAVGFFFRNAFRAQWGAVVAIPPATEMNKFLIQKFAIPPSIPAPWIPKQHP